MFVILNFKIVIKAFTMSQDIKTVQTMVNQVVQLERWVSELQKEALRLDRQEAKLSNDNKKFPAGTLTRLDQKLKEFATVVRRETPSWTPILIPDWEER